MKSTPTERTDQELRCLLAERVMGWSPGASDDYWARYNCGDPSRGDNGRMFLSDDEGDWDPLTDWRAADEVLAAMVAKGWTYLVSGDPIEQPSCEFYRRSGGDVDAHERWADTEQRAICLAAVAAMEAE